MTEVVSLVPRDSGEGTLDLRNSRNQMTNERSEERRKKKRYEEEKERQRLERSKEENNQGIASLASFVSRDSRRRRQ